VGAVPPSKAGSGAALFQTAVELGLRAVAAAGQLPAAQGGDLLAAAREAFSAGLHVVGVVAAVFYAALAVLALWAFRHMRVLQEDGDRNTPQQDLRSSRSRV